MQAKKDLWIVFDYEWDMLRFGVGMFGKQLHLYLPETESIPDLEKIHFCITESTCLHARILTDILLDKEHNGEKDDVTLKRLLPGFKDGSIVAQNAVKALQSAYGTKKQLDSPCARLNKLIAHASDRRLSTGDYREDLAKLFGPIKELYELIMLERIKREDSPPTYY